MTPASNGSFEFDSDFEKYKVCDLYKRIEQYIVKTIPDPLLTKITPMAIGFLLRTQNTRISPLVVGLYRTFEEILSVEIGIEPISKCPVVNINLSERWFLDEKPARRHPEEEGGKFA